MNGRISMTARFAAFCALTLTILCCSTLAYCQYSSNLEGQVKDPTGAVIPNATVEMTNTATQVSQKLITDTGGNFRFNSLAPGDYQVTVSSTASTLR